MSSISKTDEAEGKDPPQRNWVLPLGLLFSIGGTMLLMQVYGRYWALLFALGLALGVTLYHAAFGFASSWRRFLLTGDGQGIRAQIIMLATASLVFFPILSQGEIFDRPIVGAVAPAGLSVAFGAFLFGVGMQLAGGCASGTLYALGGGSSRMVIVLLFFMAGSVLGSAHLPFWLEWGRGDSISLVTELGAAEGLLAQLAALFLFFLITVWVERRKGFIRQWSSGPKGGLAIIWRGPWPLYAGAVALAILNIATLALAGHPWSIAFGYTLWGGKIASFAGLDLSSWTFWSWPGPSKALAGSVFENSTSVMNFGLLIGAFLAAGLAGRFRPAGEFVPRQALAAVLGGILMGYGARLAFGCNVGAYFSGIASGSLHGWLWLFAAMAGTYFGVRLRPHFLLSRI
ncbi:MAG: YeeE/YedE family protein [Kiloniellales bacterium]|nr:YeeE/YedE family protein [Kiloniellales bacterium]